MHPCFAFAQGARPAAQKCARRLQLLVHTADLILAGLLVLQRKLSGQPFGIVSDQLDARHDGPAEQEDRNKAPDNPERDRSRCRRDINIAQLFQAGRALHVNQRLHSVHLEQSIAQTLRFLFSIHDDCGQVRLGSRAMRAGLFNDCFADAVTIA